MSKVPRVKNSKRKHETKVFNNVVGITGGTVKGVLYVNIDYRDKDGLLISKYGSFNDLIINGKSYYKTGKFLVDFKKGRCVVSHGYVKCRGEMGWQKFQE